LKLGGGNAGNGLRSISEHIGNDYRVRLGIGHPATRNCETYVLQISPRRAAWVEARATSSPTCGLLIEARIRLSNKVQSSHGRQRL